MQNETINSQINKSKLKKNALFSSLSFVFISGVNFLTLPFIVGKMNFEIFGVFTLFTGMFGYFGVFDFGLGQGLIKFVSEYHAKNQVKKISSAINSCLSFQLLIFSVLICILYFLSGDIVGLFHVSKENFQQSEQAFKISLLGLFFSFISATFSSVLMGLQRYDLTSSIDSLASFLLNITLVAVLIYYRLSLLQAVLLSVSFSFLTLITYIFLICRTMPYYRPKLEFNGGIVKQFIKYSINIFLSRLSSLFSTYMVRFILAYFLTPTAVTLFVAPSKLLGAVGGILSNGANSIFPYVSFLHAQKSKDDIKQSFSKAAAIFACISIPVFLFLIFFFKRGFIRLDGRRFCQTNMDAAFHYQFK